MLIKIGRAVIVEKDRVIAVKATGKMDEYFIDLLTSSESGTTISIVAKEPFDVIAQALEIKV